MQSKIYKKLIEKYEKQKGTKAGMRACAIINKIAQITADELDESLDDEIEELIAQGE